MLTGAVSLVTVPALGDHLMTNNFVSEASPDWNTRCGDVSAPVAWSVSPVTGLAAQGVVAVGGDAAGGNVGTFNGSFSVHVGYSSGALSTGGYCQTAVGLRTLQSSVAYYTVAVGCDALMAHVTGNNQVAVGAKSMLHDVDGSGSVALGASSAYTATKVLNQVIIGDNAASSPPLGDGNDGNVYIGHFAAKTRTGGRMNVEIGETVGDIARRVDYCVHIGRGAGKNTPDGTSLAGAIGFDASASGSLRFRIGGANVVPEAASALQVISDKRDKLHTGEVELHKAREIVLGARYVEYRMNARENYEGLWDGDAEAIEAWHRGDKQGSRTHAGVYAQDEAERLAASGIDFAAFQHAVKAGGRDSWSASYEAYVPYMGAIIKDQDERIAQLEATVERLTAMVEKLTA